MNINYKVITLLVLCAQALMATSTSFALPAKSTYSKLKLDEDIQLISTAAYLNQAGTHWHIPIHIWVYKNPNSKSRAKAIELSLKAKYDLHLSTETKGNFHRRVNLLLSDNKKNKKIIIEFLGKHYSLQPTDARGHSTTIINVPKSQISSTKTALPYRVVLKKNDDRWFEGKIFFKSGAGISIISDIDDTIKLSNVTEHKKLFDNTFFKDFTAIPGISSLYKKLKSKGVNFHFVSSSPWQLYPELNTFMDDAGFPERTTSLKTVRLKDSSIFDLFKPGSKTKPLQIKPILKAYPQRQFILIGDSGEEDENVYLGIKDSFKKQILAIFIREVDPNKKSYSKNGIVYFHHPDELLPHLKNLGLGL